jgi:hypothetical protein
MDLEQPGCHAIFWDRRRNGQLEPAKSFDFSKNVIPAVCDLDGSEAQPLLALVTAGVGIPFITT